MVLMGRNSEESMSCKGGEGIRGGAHKKKTIGGSEPVGEVFRAGACEDTGQRGTGKELNNAMLWLLVTIKEASQEQKCG